MNRPICRYCRCDALEPMPSMAMYQCLVCLRVERVEASLARRHRDAGGSTFGGIPVVVNANLPDGSMYLMNMRLFVPALSLLKVMP